jgi:hypothetical protein
MSVPGKKIQGKIGKMKVEETKMQPNVPNREERPRADDVINFEGLPSKNAQEVAAEITQKELGKATAKRLGGKYRARK